MKTKESMEERVVSFESQKTKLINEIEKKEKTESLITKNNQIMTELLKTMSNLGGRKMNEREEIMFLTNCFERFEKELREKLINEIKKEFDSYHSDLVCFEIDEEEAERGESILAINPYYPLTDYLVASSAFPAAIERKDEELILCISGEGLDPREDKATLDNIHSIQELHMLLKQLQSPITKEFNKED